MSRLVMLLLLAAEELCRLVDVSGSQATLGGGEGGAKVNNPNRDRACPELAAAAGKGAASGAGEWMSGARARIACQRVLRNYARTRR